MTELAMIDRPRILVVEDDLGLQSAICRLIRDISPLIQIDGVTKADDIRKDVSDSRLILGMAYDLVVSDILLPGKTTGLDLWETCQERSPDVPFLLMSGMDVAEFKKKVAGAPFAPEFLPKPFTGAQIRARIEALLRHELPQEALGEPLKKAA